MGALTVKLFDLQTNDLATISGITFEPQLVRIHNQARGFSFTAPAGHSLLTTIAADGYRNLRFGNRKIIVWEAPNGPGDQPIFHGRVHSVERTGDGSQNLVKVTCWDPWMELGFDSQDRAGRFVRGSTAQPTAGDPFGVYDGNLITPLFASSVADQAGVSGPDMIFQILTNSQNADALLGEGPLPISLTGTFDLVIPPAVDLSCLDSMDFPKLCGDFIQEFVDTGVVDVDMRPVDPSEGFDPYVMVEMSAVSSRGDDRSDTVHFDYWTGDHNASAARHVEDFLTIDNKLFYELGPRLTRRRWTANIAPDSPGVTPSVTASRALYGVHGSIRVKDSVGGEASSRPLYLATYNAELGYRIEPRQQLYITPNPDSKALFDPPTDFDTGDIVAINIGAEFGVELAETQRVFGYTKTWTREGVARVSELLTSADAVGIGGGGGDGGSGGPGGGGGTGGGGGGVAEAGSSSRFFAVDSPFNTSGTDEVDPDSDDWIAGLVADGITNLFLNCSGFTAAVHSVLVGRDDGWVYKSVYGAGYGQREAGVPLNPSMFVPPDSDHGVIIIDEATGIIFNPSSGGLDGGGDWTTPGGSGLASYLRSRSGWWQQQVGSPVRSGFLSQTAAGTSYLAGMVFAEELANGLIPHALVCSLPAHLIRGPSNSPAYPGYLTDSAACRYPATRSDGSGGSGKIPMGARIKLPGSFDIAAFTSDPDWQTILTAIQADGMILVDSNGSTNSIVIYAPHKDGPGWPYTPGSASPTYPASVDDGSLSSFVTHLQVMTAEAAPTFETRATMMAVAGGPVYTG